MIASKAKQDDGIVYSADETAVAQDVHWVQGYSRAGHLPLLGATSQLFGLTMISAISSKGMMWFELLECVRILHTTARAGLLRSQSLLNTRQPQAHHANDVAA